MQSAQELAEREFGGASACTVRGLLGSLFGAAAATAMLVPLVRRAGLRKRLC
ncbi:hypothetical protein OHB06_01245 [Streptomyces sp. NBC_01604]|uniref:hypothetical protein n=1 Tax=Streptomyces sp. NBC_01604 TaxID=2975894 RepID=UPI00386E0BBE